MTVAVGDYVECACAPACRYSYFDGRPCCLRGVVTSLKGGDEGDVLVRDASDKRECYVPTAGLRVVTAAANREPLRVLVRDLILLLQSTSLKRRHVEMRQRARDLGCIA